MMPLSLNKALLWKEWRQSHWLFGVAFLLMSFTTIFQTLIFWIVKAIRPSVYVYNHNIDPTLWSWSIANMINYNYDSSLNIIGVYVAIGIGVQLMARERSHNTLEFLVATPVSRREIVQVKYFLGAGVILVILLVNFLFVSMAALILPAKYTLIAAVKWFALAGAVLLAIFSISFFVSIITGNSFAVLIGVQVIFSPFFIGEMLLKILACYGIIPYTNSRIHEVVSYIGEHLTLPFYLGHGDARDVGEMMLALDIPIMLLVALVFYLFSVSLFERNPLERNGQVLMFGNFMSMLKVGVPFIAAVIATAIMAEEFKLGVLIMITIFLGVCAVGMAVFSLINRIRRNLGFR